MSDEPKPVGPDLEAISRNAAALAEEFGRVSAAYLALIRSTASGRGNAGVSQAMMEMSRPLLDVAESWMNDPRRATQAQAQLSQALASLWSSTLNRMQSGAGDPVSASDPKDKRFADPEWSTNPVFNLIRQSYLITARWAEGLVEKAEGIDPHTRHKAEFYLRQLLAAYSPSNFVMTNPELLRHTLAENGENLVRGLKMLEEDIAAGGGELRVRQTDVTAFTFGKDVAVTPGEVVYRNDLMELIQYAPTTEMVLKRPFLIVPPWINKFYILDLNPEKSFIGWMVSQGLTVFVISWVNPDERHRDKDFESYMREGIETAIDQIGVATGVNEVSAAGYCVGGTLLAVTLAMQAATGNTRIKSATFLTTQVDFTHAGDLKVFADEEQIQVIEKRMAERGYLDGSRMASAFNMLRPSDLIWSYVVNNYVKGKAPLPFDLLYWNADSTRMPEANHSFYLRNCYLNNTLSRGKMVLGNVRLDLTKVKVPVFNLATREDHIAPALSVFEGSSKFGGKVDYVLAGSGHIAGVVNPPGKKAKYGYRTGGPAQGKFDAWVEAATEHEGSWWPYWFSWLEAQAPERVPARVPGEGALPTLCAAPGTYVRVKS